MNKTYYCPMDKLVHPSAREAIVCWMDHMPDLFRYYTLAQISRAIGGVSRERVRQIANSLDETSRKQPRYDHSKEDRGIQAERRRAKNVNRYKSLRSRY